MADTERLDWIESQQPHIYFYTWGVSLFLRGIWYEKDSIREAIDAARAAEGEGDDA